MAAQEQLASEPANKLSFSIFATDGYGEADRFDAWRQNIDVLFEVEPRAKGRQIGFSASVGTYNLGDILVRRHPFWCRALHP
jgi:hypothetical protein